MLRIGADAFWLATLARLWQGVGVTTHEEVQMERVKTNADQRSELWRAAWIVDGLAFRILDEARWTDVDRERLERYRDEMRRAADIIDGVLREGANDDN